MSIDFQQKYAFAFEDSDEEDYSFLPNYQPPSQPSKNLQKNDELGVINWEDNETKETDFNQFMNQPLTSTAVAKEVKLHTEEQPVEKKEPPSNNPYNFLVEEEEPPLSKTEGQKANDHVMEQKKTHNVSQSSEVENLLP